jgi:hypothetical protein
MGPDLQVGKNPGGKVFPPVTCIDDDAFYNLSGQGPRGYHGFTTEEADGIFNIILIVKAMAGQKTDHLFPL